MSVVESMRSLSDGGEILFDGKEEGSYARLRRLGNMDSKEVRLNVDGGLPQKSRFLSLIPVIGAVVFTVFYVSPVFKLEPLANSCFAILMLAAYLWGTECIPSFATAYLIPAACVWLKVGYDKDTGRRMSAKNLASVLAQRFMDPIILVFLGSLTISAALAKLEITDRVSSFILSRITPKPRVILAAIIVLNFIIAAFLSNVASTTLVLTFTLPIIRSLDPDDPFVRAILFGMAWSGNVGGMVTPIASPQNILAVSFINEGRAKGISFLQWMGFALPPAVVLVCIFWGYLCLLYKPMRPLLPKLCQHQSFKPWSWQHSVAVVVTVVTIALWSLNEVLLSDLGHVGITSLIPVVCFFSVGILNAQDFGTIRWSTLVLMGGGLAMGKAMELSGLLDLIGDGISEGLSKVKPWPVILTVLFIESILTSVINHTSAAAILFPVLNRIGAAKGCRTTMLTVAALMVSASQLFHISSFPNALISGVQRHYRAEPARLTSESFLNGTDFFLVGWPTVLVALLVLAGLGYGVVIGMKLDG
jgi:phosphate transporter